MTAHIGGAMAHAKQRKERADAAIVFVSIFVVTIAVNLQIPLYRSYADIAGYRQGLLSVTFAAYVAGLIPVLLFAGGLAEVLGPKSVLLLGELFAMGGHVLIIHDPTIESLLKTRLLQGISIGLILGPGTAYLAELAHDARRAAQLSSAAVALGLGSGGLLTSAFLAYRHSLAPGSYHAIALATLICLGATSTLRAPATSPGRGRGILRLPLVSRATFPFGAAIFLSWSLTGIILATIPAHLALVGQGRWMGLVVFVAISIGAVVQLRRPVGDPSRYVRIGYALFACALLLLCLGVGFRSTGLLFLAAALSSLSSFGFTYVGGLTETLLACGEDRARAVCGYYLLGYLGFGLPCIAVGYLADRWGLERALQGYALAAGVTYGPSRLLRGAQARASARQRPGTTSRTNCAKGVSHG